MLLTHRLAELQSMLLTPWVDTVGIYQPAPLLRTWAQILQTVPALTATQMHTHDNPRLTRRRARETPEDT